MKEEYDLKKLKVKRHGVLPALKGKSADSAKIRITISLDKDVIDYFKSKAVHRGELPYQTQINQALRHFISNDYCDEKSLEFLKSALLNDPEFVKQFTKKMVVTKGNF